MASPSLNSGRSKLLVRVALGLISASAAVTVALFTNWDRVFRHSPATVPTSTQKKVLLLDEPFNDVHNGWHVWKPGLTFDAYLQSGELIVNNRSQGPVAETIYPNHPLPVNFDVELVAVWRAGDRSNPYGVVIGTDESTYYIFGLTADGECTVRTKLATAQTLGPDIVNNTAPNAAIGNGFSFNHIRVEVRGVLMAMYVNGRRIGVASNTMVFDQWAVGVMVQGPQQVSFDNLKISIQ